MEECHQQQQGRAGAIYTGAPANRSSLTPTTALLCCTCVQHNMEVYSKVHFDTACFAFPVAQFNALHCIV